MSAKLISSLSIIVLLIVSCQGQPLQQINLNPVGTMLASAAATQTVIQSQGAVVTQEPDSGIAGQTIITDGSYYIVVQVSLEDNLPPDLPPPPEDTRWVVVVATVASSSGAGIPIREDGILLIGDNGGRYPAVPPDDWTDPPITGISLEQGQNVMGIARFAVPTGIRPVIVEWCLNESCTEVIQSTMP